MKNCKMKLYSINNTQHYVHRPLFIFEIQTTKYAPIILEKPWVIKWEYKNQGRTDAPAKWYDRILQTESTEIKGYIAGTSLNTHSWMQFFAQRAWEIAYFRKLLVKPLEKTFYFCGYKIFSWKV